MLLAAQRLGRNEGWNIIVVTGVSVLVLIVCYALLQRSFTVSSKQREAEGSMF
jgi:low affinity Fe/Cu permease